MLDFGQLIEPASLKDFLENDFGHNWKHFQGATGRFSHLLTQNNLLELIDSVEISLDRISMIHSGDALAPELYGHPGQTPHLIKPDASRILHHLSQGSALLVTHAEQLYKPLWDMAEALGSSFQDAVTVNVYLGGPGSRGFSLHIDHHDVLVFQVQGNKEWQVCEPTLKHPLVLPTHQTEPPTKTIWQGQLSDGDILYLPRGYWHRAEAKQEASLHLTFGIQPCTGIHFLGWIRKKLLSSEAFRADIPRHNPEQATAYIQALKDTLEQLENPEQLNFFLEEHSERIRLQQANLKEKIYPNHDSGE